MMRIELADEEKPVLLRVFLRNPALARKEYALNALVQDRVPVPRFLYLGETSDVCAHPYIVMEWLDAQRLELVAPNLVADSLSRLARHVGETLAAIHSFTFSHCGFFDANLQLGEPLETGGAGLIQYANGCLARGARERLGENLSTELRQFLGVNASLLDSWSGPACLTHADFGGSNILVGEALGEWKVRAVVDWEFAFAGTPFFDFGNLLRKPLGRLEDFGQEVAAGYTASGGKLPVQWQTISLLTDLTAWLEFMTRGHASQALIADARAHIADAMRLVAL
jgi:aminoglycoside phosphotransferase (APT) family kinase protein